ncbi:MAG: hypothetical protein L3J33_08760 [Rhodobacteraceae bacterium]|nr:hypothetical protein [Paracoccaceae bacterium]
MDNPSQKNRTISDLSGASALVYFPPVLFLFVAIFAVLFYGDSYAEYRFADDAYYYIVVAKNLAETGQSVFTPEILTNGYHPLWLLLLTLAGKIFGFSIVSLKIFELCVIFSGFVMAIRFFRLQTMLQAGFVTFGLWLPLYSFSFVVMETSLLFPALVLFFGAIFSTDGMFIRHRIFWLAVSSIIVVGTRIDAALFVLPILLVVPVKPLQKLAIFAVFSAAGLIYAMFNHWYFGAALPVSATIKSLGGLQFNALYWRQIIHNFDLYAFAGMRAATSPIIFSLVAILAILLPFGRSGNQTARAVIYAVLVGMVLFEIKLLFGSSWAIWNWYGYPTLILILVLMWYFRGHIEHWFVRALTAIVAPLFLLYLSRKH